MFDASRGVQTPRLAILTVSQNLSYNTFCYVGYRVYMRLDLNERYQLKELIHV
jgi:hypothetical protein